MSDPLRILLLTPPAFTPKARIDINPLPPMGLGYLAAVLEDLGHTVRIVDCLAKGWETRGDVDENLMRVGLTDEQIAGEIRDFAPDVVGINSQFSRQHRLYHSMLALAKKTAPEAVTIVGGAHATVCPEEVLEDADCDFIVMGEAEESFPALLGSMRTGDRSGLDGAGWKEDGALVIREKTRWIEDLDSIPFPAYHLMNVEMYFGLPASHGVRHRDRFMPIITSRGCPARCTFCSARRVWGDAYRKRSVDNVIAEMKLLRDEYGIEEIMFEDDNVTADPKRATELFQRMIDDELGFIWDTPNGVGMWSVDEKLLDLMQASKCIKVRFPVESGSQEVLNKIIKKPLRLNKVERLIRHCRKIGLDYSIFLVIGMPGETIRDIWKSIRFAARNGSFEPHISVATPYPGTELFDICEKEGYFSKPFTLDDLFIRSYMIRTPHWDEDDLRRLLVRAKIYLAYRSLLASPRRVLYLLWKCLTRPHRAIQVAWTFLFYKPKADKVEKVNI